MKDYPSMEEMIESCEKKRREDEVIVFALGVGRVIPMLGKMRAMKKGMNYIKTLEGFIGVHPIDLWKNLLVFDTLNNAKEAKNKLRFKGVPVGNVAPILIEKEYYDRGVMQMAERKNEG